MSHHSNEMFLLVGAYQHHSEKALKLGDGDNSYWLPFSVIEMDFDPDTLGKGEVVRVRAPRWIIENNAMDHMVEED